MSEWLSEKLVEGEERCFLVLLSYDKYVNPEDETPEWIFIGLQRDLAEKAMRLQASIQRTARLNHTADGHNALLIWHDGNCYGCTPLDAPRNLERLMPYVMSTPTEKKHDFSSGPLVLSIDVLVMNQTGAAVHDARVEAHRELSEEFRPGWLWCGITSHALGHLEADEERIVSFSACFFTQGDFQVGNIFAFAPSVESSYAESAPIFVRITDYADSQ